MLYNTIRLVKSKQCSYFNLSCVFHRSPNIYRLFSKDIPIQCQQDTKTMHHFSFISVCTSRTYRLFSKIWHENYALFQFYSSLYFTRRTVFCFQKHSFWCQQRTKITRHFSFSPLRIFFHGLTIMLILVYLLLFIYSQNKTKFKNRKLSGERQKFDDIYGCFPVILWKFRVIHLSLRFCYLDMRGVPSHSSR